MFHNSPTLKEIDVELGNDFIETFVDLLKDIKDLKSGFIMTTDLRKDPEYTFRDVKNLLNDIAKEIEEDLER